VKGDREIDVKSWLSFAYGVLVYAFFAATFAYSIGFVGDFAVPKTIDSGAHAPLAEALLVDLSLLALFALQHTVMARRSFKAWWTRFVSPALERSTFVLAATAILALLLWQWRPIPEPVIWNIESRAGVLLAEHVFFLGWVIALTSTMLLDHFELFGLSQIHAQLTGRAIPESEFRTPLLYRYVRHPLYLGFVLGFWATPRMTAGHLLFATAMTGYILIGIWFEERDLIAQFGERYHRYREQVGMLLPLRRAAVANAPTSASSVNATTSEANP
jgi:protein-S-isoprenylcysteine O-methyltransferase Ste14